jgi:inosine-uridine nucleoside N-ribohydrolase
MDRLIIDTDTTAMAVALDPEVCLMRGRRFVDVETQGELIPGMMVMDPLRMTSQEPNVEVCWAIDVSRWKRIQRQCLT